MTFKKGDMNTHYFQIPSASWSAGGTLTFIAKPAVDDDATDAAAVIDKDFDDSTIVGSGHEQYNSEYVTYECAFLPADITGVTFGTAKKIKYIGEFTFVPSAGYPETYPSDDDFIEVVIYADLKRGS